MPFNSFNLNGFTFSYSHTTPLNLDYEFVVGDYSCIYNLHNLDHKEIKKSGGLICDLISIKLENKF